MVNKFVGMSLQVSGGLLVLYSVNDNLGLFRAQSLTSAVITWFKEFPLTRKTVVVSASASTSANSTTSASASVGRTVVTIEERIAELERLQVELAKQINRQVQEVYGRIEYMRSELQNQIVDTSRDVARLSSQLEHAAVGGFKSQALGVLLVIYGAVTSVFA
jgi:hypothetical protein